MFGEYFWVSGSDSNKKWHFRTLSEHERTLFRAGTSEHRAVRSSTQHYSCFLSSVHFPWKFGICLENIYWSYEWNHFIDKCSRSTNFRLIWSILFNWYNDTQTNNDFLLETLLLYWWKVFCQLCIFNQFGIFIWHSILKILDGYNWFWIWNIIKHIYSKSNSDVLASIYVNK